MTKLDTIYEKTVFHQCTQAVPDDSQEKWKNEMSSTIALAFFLQTFLDPRAGGGPIWSMATSPNLGDRDQSLGPWSLGWGSQRPGETKAMQKEPPAICLRGNLEPLVETKLHKFRVRLHGGWAIKQVLKLPNSVFTQE